MRTKSITVILAIAASAVYAPAQSISWMGVADGFIKSAAHDVDDSGRFVVGEMADANNNPSPAVWYVGQSFRVVQSRDMLWGRARAISRQGDVVVGEYQPRGTNYTSAFVWRNPLDPNYSFRDLASYASLDGVGRFAWDVVTLTRGNQEISIVVGHEIYSDNRSIGRPARYEINWSTGQHSAQDLLGNAYPRHQHVGDARAISADGSRIVGFYATVGGSSQGFFYDGTVKFVSEPSANLVFTDIADDTLIVSAITTHGNISRAKAWVWNGSVLQNLGGFTSYAFGISADGNRVVGTYLNQGTFRACLWDRGVSPTRFVDLTTEYLSILNGSRLEFATAISSDGRYIVGVGYNAENNRQEGFILDTRPSCQSHNGDVDTSGCVDDADLLAILFAFGQTGINLGRVDVNCDGAVDDADLLVVLFNFGVGCS